MELGPELEKYLSELGKSNFSAPPRQALFAAAGGELYGPEMHLVFNAPVYIFIGENIRRQVNPPKKILDIGCGTGYDTLYLKKHYAPNASIIGLDRVGTLVKYAARHYSQPGLQFMTGDCSDLPFPSASLDLVIAVFSIVHTMSRANALICLGEICRALKPGGTLIFSTPNRKLSQALYHENPDDDNRLFFCHLLRSEYYQGQLADLLHSLDGDNRQSFESISIDTLTNMAFRPVWKEVLTRMREKRFGSSRKMAFLSSLARSALPAGFKARYFFRMVSQECQRQNVSLLEIARGAQHYPESEQIEADHFLVVARKSNQS